MNERLEMLKEKTRSGWFKRFRQNLKPEDLDFTAELTEKGLDAIQGDGLIYQRMFELETPVIVPGERIVFTRTVNLPVHWQLNRDLAKRTEGQWGWQIENLSPDCGLVLAEGLGGRREAARAALKIHADDPEAVEYLESTIAVIDAAEALVHRYVAAAEAAGETEQAALLRRVPMQGARTFHEALQSLRFVSALLRLGAAIHLGFGRFDQYMLPYFERDLAAGTLTREAALELTEEFFLSLNRDSDIYPGIQQGDNGQSLMLGGCTPDGKSAVNLLTYLALEASCELGMIDPKINLRIDSHTPEDLLELAAKLTRRGLGFPQYCNDEKVIPGLVEFGYPLEAARDYTVAACWEYVVEDGRDTPNIASMNFPLAIDQAIREGLAAKEDFAGILARIKPAMHRQADRAAEMLSRQKHFPPDLLFSACTPHCIARGRDLNCGGGSHYHYGMHGAGSSSAADALAAVKQLVFDEKNVASERLLAALEDNFEHDAELREMLKTLPSKVGNNDDRSDAYLKLVFDDFAEVLAELGTNPRGGRWRPGTGSAQGYVQLTQERYAEPGQPFLAASADGRKKGDYISSSLSPAPGTRSRGVMSVLQSYGKLDYGKLCNGGPITMELAESYFSDDSALERTAQLIRGFVASGCQQLQLNTLNPDKLRDAQRHPAHYRDLIVRVWGWSGYFVELAREYQDQIIRRQSFCA